ncbi:hypothetical protein FHR83_005926 [Actinoplanes campanulatus]|uniref:Uncharacterized protein n=1 Tax=Actinoplanes campanulatus TaxID=113559 RepID=A0A7W5FH60_9ACTN|nr:hypothetical protein [Actinoplanes campanulatus]MBB3098231.1 hypothetical protein [Actinoplanes campanulatus]GGN34829.1 hypothetical protein GCM10010109_58250 [Actinoplanes campanulatus]GID38811.1 hypothetical protein Aca09nite_53170 [Actinoplanes campanulatus]
MFASLARALFTTATAAAVLVGTTGSALAATNTLTVTTLNRAGTKVAVTTTVVNLSTAKHYQVRSGVKRTLPKGNYAVLARISTGITHTLGGRTVKVSGASKLTIDARQGRLVNLGLSPAPSGLSRTQGARICAEGAPFGGIELYVNGADSLYVIPSASKYLSYAALGYWNGYDAIGGYAVLHQTTKGVPSTTARVFSTAKLGAVTVDSRRGPSAGTSAQVDAQAVGGGCGDYMMASLGSSDRPSTSKLYLSPGKWDIRTSGSGTATNGEGRYVNHFTTNRTIAAGKAYFVRFSARPGARALGCPPPIRAGSSTSSTTCSRTRTSPGWAAPTAASAPSR